MITEAEDRISEIRNPQKANPVEDLKQSNMERKGVEEKAAEQDLADLQGRELSKSAPKTSEELLEERCRKLIEAEMDEIRTTRRDSQSARP